MPVAVPIATRAEHEPLTPTLVASLIKRFETQGQVAEVGARSKPAAPVSPGNSLSSFQHPHQQATFRPPANTFPPQGPYNNQGVRKVTSLLGPTLCLLFKIPDEARVENFCIVDEGE